MVDFFHFGPKIQTHKIRYKYKNLVYEIIGNFLTPILNILTIPVWSIFFILDQKSKLIKFSTNLNILVVYPVSIDKMSSVVRPVSFGTIKSLEIFWPQIWKFDHAGMADLFAVGAKYPNSQNSQYI